MQMPRKRLMVFPINSKTNADSKLIRGFRGSRGIRAELRLLNFGFSFNRRLTQRCLVQGKSIRSASKVSFSFMCDALKITNKWKKTKKTSFNRNTLTKEESEEEREEDTYYAYAQYNLCCSWRWKMWLSSGLVNTHSQSKLILQFLITQGIYLVGLFH